MHSPHRSARCIDIAPADILANEVRVDEDVARAASAHHVKAREDRAAPAHHVEAPHEDGAALTHNDEAPHEDGAPPARHVEAARDHKRLGAELDIFAFDDEIGRGLPLWLPNGTVIRDELEKLMRELEFEAGFQRVVTPHVTKRDLYFRTGHLPYYAVHMFPPMVVQARSSEDDARSIQARSPSEDDARSVQARSSEGDAAERDVYCLRPMNCPHHHKIFAARPRSYRDLPLRLAEYGQLYRYEDSGAISGLLRVRGMSMNDGHIYCTGEQVVSECLAVIAMHRHVYRVLGLDAWRVRLSTRGDGPDDKHKYVDNPGAWRSAEEKLRQVLFESGLPFEEGPGEGAFYGPKIDFQFRSATGREETASTLQLDFVMSERLDLRYVGPDGADHRPYILHRAPLGTHERFVALLLEHFAGAFPPWLAPEQVRVVPVAEGFLDYAKSIEHALRAKQIRAHLDGSTDGLNKKIRNAAVRKIPYILVVGEKERANGRVTVRRRGQRRQACIPFASFQEEIAQKIAERQLA